MHLHFFLMKTKVLTHFLFLFYSPTHLHYPCDLPKVPGGGVVRREEGRVVVPGVVRVVRVGVVAVVLGGRSVV